MENKYLLKFKQQLEKIKKEIERRLKGLQKVPEFGAEIVDDETHESQAFGNQLSIAQVLKDRLIAVQTALRKFRKNRYGLCEQCGKTISEDLLKLVPESKLCKECKKKL